jgi:hypothetical protein
LIVVGFVIVLGCGVEFVGGAESDPDEPQAAKHPAASAAIRAFGRNLMFMDVFRAYWWLFLRVSNLAGH